MSKVENNVISLIEPIINSLGYSLYDVRFVKEGKDYYLKVFIDNNNGININDCENVSNNINSLLDDADFIKEQYFLEVSSCGLERILRKEKHFKENIGKEIYIKLYNKEFKGILVSYTTDKLVIKTDSEEISFNLTDILLAKTVYNF